MKVEKSENQPFSAVFMPIFKSYNEEWAKLVSIYTIE